MPRLEGFSPMSEQDGQNGQKSQPGGQNRNTKEEAKHQSYNPFQDSIMLLWSQDYLHFNKSQKAGDGCVAAYSSEISWEYQFQHYSESRTEVAPQLIAEQRGSSSIISILWLQAPCKSHEVGWQYTLRSWDGCQFESHLDRRRKNSRAAATLHRRSHTKFKVEGAQACLPRAVAPHFTVSHRCVFYRLKARPSTSEKIAIHFTAV